MDKMMDVTGALVCMEESDLSLGREEHFMDVIIEAVMVQPEMMDATSNISGRREMMTEQEDWPEDTIFQDKNFEEWVEC